MHFFFFLKPKSAKDRQARQHRLATTWVEGVAFRFSRASDHYETDELTESQIEALKREPQVVFEVLNTLPENPLPATKDPGS